MAASKYPPLPAGMGPTIW